MIQLLVIHWSIFILANVHIRSKILKFILLSLTEKLKIVKGTKIYRNYASIKRKSQVSSSVNTIDPTMDNRATLCCDHSEHK